jgi:hypothetical protein
MIPPRPWLVSEAASGVTGGRFAVKLCDSTLALEQNARHTLSKLLWAAFQSRVLDCATGSCDYLMR